MKPIKVIKRNNLPAKLPISSTVTCLLALDYWHASQWLWGVFGALFLVHWILIIVTIIIQEESDVFK